MNRILPVLLLGAAVAIANAQTSSALLNASGPSALFEAKQLALQNSLTLFASANLSTAESTLEAANLAPPNTPAWHFESGSELLTVAALFHAAGNAATCGTVVNLALGHLLQADQLYAGNANPATIASEKTTIGYVYERYLGNLATAEQYYQAALAADPGYPQAAAALGRIQSRLATERQRFGAGIGTNN